jgi:hypothetical protein
VFLFEQVFSGEARYHYLDDLVSFATSLPEIDSEGIGSTEGWLEWRIHQSSGDFPAWGAWSVEQKRQFEEICGPLMERLGYTL